MNDRDTVQPTRTDERIDTLDVLRGVAICGILLMNIPGMGGVLDTEGLFYPARWNADWIAWVVQDTLFAGTMRGLFTMLFGAGMLLMLRKAEGPAPQVTPFDVWTRRSLALMVLGIVQFAVFLWPGEILFCYGVTGLGLLAFRTARPRALLTAALVVYLGMAAFATSKTVARTRLYQASIPAAAAKAAGLPLTKEQQAALAAVKKNYDGFHPTQAAMNKEIAERTRFPSVFAWSRDKWAEYNLSADGWRDMAESLAFMLVGMALFRTGILTGTAPAATYRRLMLWGYGLGLAFRIWGKWWEAQSGFELDVHRIHLPVSLLFSWGFEPARLAITLGHVGLVVSLFREGALGQAWLLRALGRMALTVYSLQSILTSLLFYTLGYVGAFTFAQLMAIAVAIWLVTGAFCVLWLRTHAMGPAEWLLRAVAYGTFRRHRPAAAAVLATAPSL